MLGQGWDEKVLSFFGKLSFWRLQIKMSVAWKFRIHYYYASFIIKIQRYIRREMIDQAEQKLNKYFI